MSQLQDQFITIGSQSTILLLFFALVGLTVWLTSLRPAWSTSVTAASVVGLVLLADGLSTWLLATLLPFVAASAVLSSSSQPNQRWRTRLLITLCAYLFAFASVHIYGEDQTLSAERYWTQPAFYVWAFWGALSLLAPSRLLAWSSRAALSSFLVVAPVTTILDSLTIDRVSLWLLAGVGGGSSPLTTFTVSLTVAAGLIAVILTHYKSRYISLIIAYAIVFGVTLLAFPFEVASLGLMVAVLGFDCGSTIRIASLSGSGAYVLIPLWAVMCNWIAYSVHRENATLMNIAASVVLIALPAGFSLAQQRSEIRH